MAKLPTIKLIFNTCHIPTSDRGNSCRHRFDPFCPSTVFQFKNENMRSCIFLYYLYFSLDIILSAEEYICIKRVGNTLGLLSGVMLILLAFYPALGPQQPEFVANSHLVLMSTGLLQALHILLHRRSLLTPPCIPTPASLISTCSSALPNLQAAAVGLSQGPSVSLVTPKRMTAEKAV